MPNTTCYRAIACALCLASVAAPTAAQRVEQMIHAKPVLVSGSMDATTIFYQASGITPRYPSFNYVVTGSPVISVYGWSIPFSFVIGKEQNSFSQPFNQIGLSPTYKWITIHAGYRNLSFSPYTLAGHTFLGGGMELNPGKFRFAFIYGRFNRATPLDTAERLYFSSFSYRRTGMSVKIGYGSSNNYIDLIALKAKDDPSSLNQGKGPADSLGIAPAENTVTGYTIHLTLWKQVLSLESNGALSLYTTDVNAPRIQDSSYGKDVKKVDDLVTVRTSSELYGAFDAAIRYRTRNFSLRLQYRHIDPGYQSMGAYFLNNDLENYTFSPSLTLFRHRLRFSGSLGLQKDDLAGNKRARSHKTIGSANLTAEITERLGADLSFTNYSINQTVKTLRFADSLKVVESSRQFAFSPRYMISGATVSHSILASANICQARELNPARTDSLGADIDTYNYLVNYQLSLIQQQAAFTLCLNHTEMKGAGLTDGNQGATLGGSKTWEKGKLIVSANAGYLLSKRNEEKGRILTGSFQLRYRLFKGHALHLMAYYTDNTPDHPTSYYPKYTETRAEAGYGFSF